MKTITKILFITVLVISITNFVKGQNITLETTKKEDEFTKTISITVVPKEEMLVGRKVVKETMYLEALKTLPELSAKAWMIYNKQDNGTEIFWIKFYKIVDLGCMSKHDGKAIILFEDGETLELTQVSETDCGDIVNATYLITPREVLKADNIEEFINSQNKSLAILAEKKVSKIRLEGSKYYKDLEIRPEVKDIFQKMVSEIQAQLED